MLRFILSVIGGLFSLITLGAVFSALVLGAIIYMYGRDLPNHAQLSQYAPPTDSRIFSAQGRIIAEYHGDERRTFTPIEDVPEMVKAAFISAEDKNFYEHRGFDPVGIASAVRDYLQGGRLRGASTIPQQVVKNMLLSNDRTAERKIKEIILSVRLVQTLDKDKILELYLNEINLGGTIHGITAAARYYFNKPVSDLTVPEAAYLAGLPQAPSRLHPVRNEAEAIARRNYVIGQMRENGYIDADTFEEARIAPLLSVQGGDFEGYTTALPPRDYFTDEIRRQLSRDFGEDQFLSGGLTVRATYDPEMQEEAARALRRQLEAYDREQGRWRGTGLTVDTARLGTEEDWREALAEVEIARDIDGWFPAVVLEEGNASVRIGIEGVPEDADGHFIPQNDVGWIRGANTPGDILDVGDVVHVRAMTSDSDGSFIRWTLRQVPEVQGGFMAMDVNTGRVIALQGGFSYQHSAFNRATQATRQPGSSFKPFVYAAALDSGFTPATIIVDAPIEVDVGGGEVWRPKNASREFYGPTPLRTGIERSRNLMTVRLAEEIGMDTVASYAEHFGVYDRMGRYLANALGSEETTLYRMVAAYAMFANGGQRIQPTLVDRVQDRWGNTIYRHDNRVCEECGDTDLAEGRAPRIISNRRQVIDPVTAYQLTSMMRGVVERGTAAGAVNLPVPTAGKTGTTNDARDVWFVGFTSNIAAGCYIGYDNPRPLSGGRASGGKLCAPVFQDFMTEAVEKFGGGPFEVPPGGRFIKIDRITGARLPDYAEGPEVVAEYFREGEQPVFGVTYDGGFAMGANLPIFTPEGAERTSDTVTVRSGGGEDVNIPTTRDVGTISSGGLY